MIDVFGDEVKKHCFDECFFAQSQKTPRREKKMNEILKALILGVVQG